MKAGGFILHITGSYPQSCICLGRTDLSLSEVNVFRKLLLVALLGGAVAALPAPLGATYTVVKGDTVYSLAKRYGLSVDRLLAMNHLDSDALEVGQVLFVASASYTVVKGDTAYSIARNNGLSVGTLLSFNGMQDPHLEVGQVLSLVPPVVPAPPPALPARPSAAPADAALPAPGPNFPDTSPMPAPTAAMSSTDWLANAQSLLGVPYVWGAQSRVGTDCSGFVVQVFAPLGLNLPRTSAAQAQVGQPVARQELQRGDLVFFDTEGRGRVTHVGIALGGNEFINANSYAGRVAIDDLGSRYWASRYVGARRVLGTAMANAAAMH